MTADDDDPARELRREAWMLARRDGDVLPLTQAQKRYLNAFDAWLETDQGNRFSSTYQERERCLVVGLDEAGMMPTPRQRPPSETGLDPRQT